MQRDRPLQELQLASPTGRWPGDCSDASALVAVWKAAGDAIHPIAVRPHNRSNPIEEMPTRMHCLSAFAPHATPILSTPQHTADSGNRRNLTFPTPSPRHTGDSMGPISPRGKSTPRRLRLGRGTIRWGALRCEPSGSACDGPPAATATRICLRDVPRLGCACGEEEEQTVVR